MEEWIGNLWHRWITAKARQGDSNPATELSAVMPAVGIFFRALGGCGGIQITASAPRPYFYARGFLQKVAGSHRALALPCINTQRLQLPVSVALWTDPALNRELYLWWAVLAAQASSDPRADLPWFQRNQYWIKRLLQRFPGWRGRYCDLQRAHIAQRPPLESYTATEREVEQAIRQALCEPGSVDSLPQGAFAPYPVWLWLYPDVDSGNNGRCSDTSDNDNNASSDVYQENVPQELALRRRGQTVYTDDGRDGLLVFRLENLFSWSEMVNLDRCTDDSVDPDAARVARDLELIHVSRQRQSLSAQVKFDLDLPAAENDELALGEGLLLPEWDYRRDGLRNDYCCVQPMLNIQAESCPLPERLVPLARRLRTELLELAPIRLWHRRQSEGEELDMDAWLQYRCEMERGAVADQELYKNFRGKLRDLDCLLLADLSMSTEAYINNERRVIDIIQDSLLLFSEALTALGDRFALYGFSSRSRRHVRFHLLKNFNELYGDRVRGRLMQLKPGFYTRMGAALRQATRVLTEQPGQQRLLLLLTDGKPNDIDHYEGRYGIEDTRVAVREAKAAGITPFCITIDKEGGEYLPYLFGTQGYATISSSEQLPKQLPRLYATLTQ